MKKAKTKTAPKSSQRIKKLVNAMPIDLTDEGAKEAFRNGLTEAIMGYNPGTFGTQLSQTDTLFVNMRWYLVSNMRQLLSEAYAEIGLVQTIVDVPVDDGFRGGVDIKTKQLSEDEIHKLQATLERQGDINEVAQANKWNRLYGGAAVLIMTNQDPSTPLDLNAIKEDTPIKFRAVDMWELFFDKVSIDEDLQNGGPQLGSPDDITFETFNYYGKKIHKSRIMPMKGLLAPSFIRPRLRGWGFSCVEALVRSMNQYLKASDLGFEVLDEFKLDIYKIKGLSQALLNANGEAQIRKRVSLANTQKNYQNAITMDSEDDYIQKQLSWAGLADAMAGIRMQVAADLRMPMTKLFGVSSAGFNSGEDDIEVYNSMVESQVRSKCKYEIVRVIEIRCQQMFGHVPDDLSIDFKPLRIMSAEQEENVKTQVFNRVLSAKTAGEINSLEFREACNRDELLPIQLETDDDTMAGVEDEKDQGNDEDGDKEETVKKIGETKKSALIPDNAPNVENSLGYDVASFETDGGVRQFDPYRERDLENPDRMPDRELIKRGEDASMRAFGKIVWQFVVYHYKQHGGRFL